MVDTFLLCRCCATQGACANWPQSGGETNFNFCGVSNQRCDAQGLPPGFWLNGFVALASRVL